MDDTWVTLVDGVAAAGHGVAHLCPLERTLAADHVVFTTAPAHYVPLRARAVIVQMPVIIWPRCPLGQRGKDEDEEEEPALIPRDNTVVVGGGSRPGE